MLRFLGFHIFSNRTTEMNAINRTRSFVSKDSQYTRAMRNHHKSELFRGKSRGSQVRTIICELFRGKRCSHKSRKSSLPHFFCQSGGIAQRKRRKFTLLMPGLSLSSPGPWRRKGFLRLSWIVLSQGVTSAQRGKSNQESTGRNAIRLSERRFSAGLVPLLGTIHLAFPAWQALF